MMKKQFFSPEAELILLDHHDVIRTSGKDGIKILGEDDDKDYGVLIPLG